MDFLMWLFVVWTVWEIVGIVVLLCIGLDATWRNWIMKSPNGLFSYLAIMAWPTILCGYIVWRIRHGQKHRN